MCWQNELGLEWAGMQWPCMIKLHVVTSELLMCICMVYLEEMRRWIEQECIIYERGKNDWQCVCGCWVGICLLLNMDLANSSSCSPPPGLCHTYISEVFFFYLYLSLYHFLLVDPSLWKLTLTHCMIDTWQSCAILNCVQKRHTQCDPEVSIIRSHTKSIKAAADFHF